MICMEKMNAVILIDKYKIIFFILKYQFLHTQFKQKTIIVFKICYHGWLQVSSPYLILFV